MFPMYVTANAYNAILTAYAAVIASVLDSTNAAATSTTMALAVTVASVNFYF